ncbi:MAG: radical SAM protein, partial [Treponema sp.]|nr:radical SAM protein [Treponema sp.]
SINTKTKAVVQMTLTTADDELCKVLEPGVCPTSRRVQVLLECKRLGIPTVVWLSPLLPFINDTQENIDAIFDYCVEAGVKAILCFGIGLTLREGNREYFYAALERAALRDQRFAGLKERYQKTYGNNYVVSSPRERELMARLSRRCEENNIMLGTDSVFKWMEEFPAAAQDPMQPELF